MAQVSGTELRDAFTASSTSSLMLASIRNGIESTYRYNLLPPDEPYQVSGTELREGFGLYV